MHLIVEGVAEFSGLITEQSKAKPLYFQIIFDTQLKSAQFTTLGPPCKV